MTLTRPNKLLDAAELEHWAERYAPHQFTAYEYSDACEYLDFWEWLDLTHPGVLGDFESWYRKEHLAEKENKMSAEQQNKLVADYIMVNVPGEPSGDTGGAGDCAVRLLSEYRAALSRIMHELGVPSPGYPVPVANAYEIAKQTLGSERMTSD